MAITRKNFKQQLKANIYWNSTKVFGLLVLPLVLLLLPATFFDEGQSICLSMLLANTECYGCGMTRAVMHLIHLEPEQALYYNKLSFVVLPLLAFIWGQHIYKESLHLYKLSKN
ncbi:DUF2752 domain-containing protein [Pontibacter harenae]|uniref:DUF2752 domain-containing protein n=1 Tax=Pontibacter harenae TaxID=2894083 RepID=UPI001E3F82BF|nr:DUF2752 domain-containing protein [Pontibacter harenae]MCC9165275.1 DUF2752 domain-containing protein [Pontibacter harenae]